MKSVARAGGILVSAALALALAQQTAVPETTYWPRDAEERLSQVEAQALDTMRELSAAQLRGDNDAVERLSREFKQLQGERVRLLRATQRLPR